MGSSRGVVVLAFALPAALAPGCGKESADRTAPAPQGDVRVEIGDCAAAEVAFVSGPRPGPGTPAVPGTLGDEEIYGGLLGNEVGEQTGAWGFGYSGVGPAGGPMPPGGWGTIGTGRYGRIGHGTGSGIESGYGTGSGGSRSHRKPLVHIGDTSATGSLDKNIIRRYIRQKVPHISHCYEKQLLVNEDLAGTVTASFVIGPSGDVAVSSAEGVDPELSHCVASVVKTIEFPKPKGGGIVRVNYPFTFKPEERAEPSGARTEGQIQFKRQVGDPTLARKQALDAARDAGILAVVNDPAPPAAAVAARPAVGAGSPLRGHETELAACFRAQKAGYGVAVVELGYDAAGAVTASKVHGIEGAEFAACVTRAAATLRRVAPEGAAQRCSVAFGTMPIADAPGVDITTDALRVRGQKLLDPASIMMDQSATMKLAPLFDAASAPAPDAVVAIRGPWVIRAIADTRMKVVNRTVATLLMANADVVLAAPQGTGWRMLRDIPLPVVPVAAGTGARWHDGRAIGPAAGATAAAVPRAQLSVLLADDWTISVGTTTGEHVQLTAAADQPAQLVRALRDLKGKGFADRTDAEIAGADQVTFGQVVMAIDAMTGAGFTDWQLMDPNSMTVRFAQ
jgi:hypothetical protein